MPESKVRKEAAAKKTSKRKRQTAEKRAENTRRVVASTRDWVPYVFIPVGLLGVLWLIVYYVAGANIGFMAALGAWNMLIGMGLMAAAFVIATFWK